MVSCAFPYGIAATKDFLKVWLILNQGNLSLLGSKDSNYKLSTRNVVLGSLRCLLNQYNATFNIRNEIVLRNTVIVNDYIESFELTRMTDRINDN